MKLARPKSHYDTLRIDRRASGDRVRQAYRRMAQKCHPDKHAGACDAAALMARINEAYAVLSDPARRAAYDASLEPGSGGAARGARAAALAAGWQDRFGWSGWLLLAIASITVLTLGYVLLQARAPVARVFQPPQAASAAPLVDSAPIAPVEAIQPWREPVRLARPPHEATDPVTRLVREGVVTPAPARRRDQPKAQ